MTTVDGYNLVNENARPTVRLSRQVIQPGIVSAVEIWITQDDSPVSDATVVLANGRYGTVTTDSSGRASVTLKPSENQTIPVDVSGPTIAPVRVNLFSLDERHAGVEVTGSDHDGTPLTSYTVAVESLGADRYIGGEDSWRNGPVGRVVPAGEAYVELARAGSPFYLLGTTLTLEGGVVTTIHFESSDLPEIQLSATLDEEPIMNGRVAFHRSGTRRSVWMQGAYLDETGVGSAYVSPGQYEVQVKRTFRADPLLATFRGLSVDGGSLSFPLHRAEMGEVETQVTVAGTSVEHGRYISNAEFLTFVSSSNPVVLAMPGEYATMFVQPFLPQENGEIWEYGIEGEPVAYTVVAGERVSHSWTGDIVKAQVWTDRESYNPGDRLSFRQNLLTADGWKLYNVFSRERRTNVGLLDISITDADGTEVTSGTGLQEGSYSFPIPADPSPSYTIRVSRDLGVLGTYETSANIELAEQLEIQVKPETIRVGKTTPVKIQVFRNGVPVGGEPVTITGESDHSARLNPKGMATIPLRATRAGMWQVKVRNTTVNIFAVP